jgi:hypothetical protein
MDREEQIEKEELEQQELERLESNAGVYDDDFVDEYAYIDQEEEVETLNPRHLNYLKSVLIAQLLLEANDELKGSQAFKQNIKYQVGKTNKLLEQVYQEGFNTIYYNNPEMCTNVLNKIDSLIHKIKVASIDELVIIDALVDQYFNNKEEINETQTAEFTKIE